MRLLIAALCFASLTLPAVAAPRHHGAGGSPVLMISIDGLRPLDVIEPDQQGFTAPNYKN